MPSADSLFKLSTNKGKGETVVILPPNKISSFPNHPFQIRDDEKMVEMVASVKKYGVLIPAIVRKKEDGEYEMVAGHKRQRASVIAEKDGMPCIIRDLTD